METCFNQTGQIPLFDKPHPVVVEGADDTYMLWFKDLVNSGMFTKKNFVYPPLFSTGFVFSFGRNLDFADIRNYPPEQHSGFIVLRVAGRGKRHIMEVFERVVPMLETEVLAKQRCVVDEQSGRIRGDAKERS